MGNFEGLLVPSVYRTDSLRMSLIHFFVVFLVVFSIANGFSVGVRSLHSSNKMRFYNGRSMANAMPIKSARVQVNRFTAEMTSIFFNFNVLAYDTAYSDSKESLRGRIMDHKYGKYLYYDFDANEVVYGLGFFLLSVVCLNAIWFGDSILSFFGVKKRSGENFPMDILRAWYRFRGLVKTDEEMKKQLAGVSTESDNMVKPQVTQTFECEKCHMQLMPAKGRASVIMSKPTFRCARCGSKAVAYFDINDMSDDRAVSRKTRLENEQLDLDEDEA